VPLIGLLAVLFVTVPFLFWYQTWFGRQLTDKDLEQYLRELQHPRKVQHALTQISQRMSQGYPGVQAWYGRVVALAAHPTPEIRTTVAWVMGQDNTCPMFHQTLIKLLSDGDLMVRRNAALSLVRFGDACGRAELLTMLRALAVQAPAAGKLFTEVQAGQSVGRGTLLAALASGSGQKHEIRSPYSGTVERIAAADSTVAQGDELAVIGPDPTQAWEALRALYIIGQADDLRDVDRFQQAAEDIPPRVRQQAASTAQAIRIRAARTPTH
jgi:hypothetical protein